MVRIIPATLVSQILILFSQISRIVSALFLINCLSSSTFWRNVQCPGSCSLVFSPVPLSHMTGRVRKSFSKSLTVGRTSAKMLTDGIIVSGVNLLFGGNGNEDKKDIPPRSTLFCYHL